ncbi:hypothetical protein AB4Z46_15480 [Variovorax sp. M-6]|uniref:hypothetical protein n=1 Tax=Variovorax sp. M-6 TaxID=3233041 RepID=UPI003F9B78C1
MLTTDQKEAILRRAGIAVPDFPPGHANTQKRNSDQPNTSMSPEQRGAQAARRVAIEQWAATIDALYVEYVAARAAKSLRDAEEVRQLSMLRQAGHRSRA